MGMTTGQGSCRRALLGLAGALVAVVVSGSCGNSCGLGLQGRLVVRDIGAVPCCNGFAVRDVQLTARDAEIDLANAAGPSTAPAADAFLTDPSCSRLFEGPYPGATPNPACRVYLGPVKPGTVSNRVQLAPGTYRVFCQSFNSSSEIGFCSPDVGVWTHACRAPVGAGQ